MPNTKSFVIEVELTAKQVASISERIKIKASDAEKIAGLAQAAVNDLADGGIVIPGHVARQITEITGELGDPQELVKFVEGGKGMNGGRQGYAWYPDPTFQPVLEETARSQGCTVEQVVQDIMDYGVSQGWTYSMAPDTSIVFLSKHDMDTIRRVTGISMPTGSDIAGLLVGGRAAA